MKKEPQIYEEILTSTPPEKIADIEVEAEKLFNEFPFDNAMICEEEDFAVEDGDDLKSMSYITREEKERLADENIPLVYYIVRRFKNTQIDEDELLSVALMGYEKALSKFNPVKATKFSTFAYRCIQNEIYYFIRNEKKINEKNISLNTTISTDKNGNDLEVEDVVQTDGNEMDEEIIKDELTVALLDIINNHLTPNEKLIITKRYGIGTDVMTQNDLANMVSMSQANISKKEKNILDKMRKLLISKYRITSSR